MNKLCISKEIFTIKKKKMLGIPNMHEYTIERIYEMHIHD